MDFIKGSDKIIADYGYWPTFHDDCITKIVIDGSSIDFFIRMVTSPNRCDDYNVCITFDDVEKFDLSGELYGTVSVVLDLVFKREEIITCEIFSSMGTCGEIRAKEVSIRKLYIEIDLNGVQESKELHNLLSYNLGFPEFYGMNWDAFSDAITGLVPMPRILAFKDWKEFETNFKEDAAKLKELLHKYRDEFDEKFEVKFK